MKKAIMLPVSRAAGVACAGAGPSGTYGSGNIIFPNDPAAAAAAAAYGTNTPGVAGGAFAYEPVRGGDCAQRFKSYDPRSGTYLGHDGRRHICR